MLKRIGIQMAGRGRLRGLAERVFVNNQIDLSKISIFGFDYDYTLAEYKEPTQKFIFDIARNRLVNKYGFPKNILKLEFNPDFIIRGLFYDPKRCVMMKLDSYSVIDDKAAFRGLTPLSESELDELYSTRRMGVHRVDPNFVRRGRQFYQVLDEFSIPEAYLFSSVYQFFEDNNLRFDPILMFNAIRQAIADVHISRTLYHEVINNLDKHLEKNSMQNVISHLSSSKKLFVISNSPFWFIDAGMKHLVGHDWRDAFEIIISEAKKPSFFLEDRPFLEMQDGCRNGAASFEKKSNWLAAKKLEKGKIYYEGSLSEFGRLTNWDQKSVLYFGDQVTADLAEPSLRFGWRTAAIIPELEKEIAVFEGPKFKQLVHRLNELEFDYHKVADKDAYCETSAKRLLKERRHIKDDLKKAFPSPFGSIFRSDLSRTHYARQVERYAELYTSSIRNLDQINVDRTFFPPRLTLGYDHRLNSLWMLPDEEF